jgi:hypothetical protein
MPLTPTSPDRTNWKLYRCPPCIWCGTVMEVDLPPDKLNLWRNGAYIQDAFPDMTADERELLLTGTCPGCWPEDDEEF